MNAHKRAKQQRRVAGIKMSAGVENATAAKSEDRLCVDSRLVDIEEKQQNQAVIRMRHQHQHE